MWPLIVLGGIAGLALLWLLLWYFLTAPKKCRNVAEFVRPYAHRGLLWGEGSYPENSLPAFRAAAEAGFAIELDVQLSRDGEVFVFHDYTLTRMCGRPEKLAELTAAELSVIPLAGSDERIPTLAEVLEAVGGRVPLLIELKGESGDTAVCPATRAVLSGYPGKWCVESFNPLLLCEFRKNAPQVVRGLLITDVNKEKKEGSRLLGAALSRELLNFLCRPHFVAWDKKYPKGRARRAALHRHRAASFVFTVRNEAEFSTLTAAGHAPIFDSFLPNGKGN